MRGKIATTRENWEKMTQLKCETSNKRYSRIKAVSEANEYKGLKRETGAKN